MNSQEISTCRDQIVNAIQDSSKRFLAEKKLNNQKIIVSENGVIKKLNAKDIK